MHGLQLVTQELCSHSRIVLDAFRNWRCGTNGEPGRRGHQFNGKFDSDGVRHTGSFCIPARCPQLLRIRRDPGTYFENSALRVIFAELAMHRKIFVKPC